MTSERLVLAIGQPCGPVRTTGTESKEFRVRLGDALIAMGDAICRVWFRALGTTTHDIDTPRTRAAIVEEGEESLFDELVEAGLIVEVDPNGDDAVAFARTHRLIPHAHGSGNRPDDVSLFTVGSPPHVAGFSWVLYRLWQRAHHEESLWDACCAVSEFDDEGDARIFLAELLVGVRMLLTFGYATLDVLRPEQPAVDAVPDLAAIPEPTDDWLVFPVGHDLGPYIAKQDEPPSYRLVFAGRVPYGLRPDASYTAWKLAHDAPAPLTLGRYRETLVKTGIPDILDYSNQLCSENLVWATTYMPDGHDQAIHFLLAHRLVPMGMAFGNVGTGSPPDHFGFGWGGSLTHHVYEIGYWLWTWGPRYDDMWQLCNAFARSSLGRKHGDGDPDQCVGFVLMHVQDLILKSLAFLDVAWHRRGTAPPPAKGTRGRATDDDQQTPAPDEDGALRDHAD